MRAITNWKGRPVPRTTPPPCRPHATSNARPVRIVARGTRRDGRTLRKCSVEDRSPMQEAAAALLPMAATGSQMLGEGGGASLGGSPQQLYSTSPVTAVDEGQQSAAEHSGGASASPANANAHDSAPEVVEGTHDYEGAGPKYKRGRGRSFFREQARRGAVVSGAALPEQTLVPPCHVLPTEERISLAAVPSAWVRPFLAQAQGLLQGGPGPAAAAGVAPIALRSDRCSAPLPTSSLPTFLRWLLTSATPLRAVQRYKVRG